MRMKKSKASSAQPRKLANKVCAASAEVIARTGSRVGAAASMASNDYSNRRDLSFRELLSSGEDDGPGIANDARNLTPNPFPSGKGNRNGGIPEREGTQSRTWFRSF